MNTLRSLHTVNQKIAHLSLSISAVGIVAMTVVIGWQVFSRYVLNESPAWSETVALLLMLYYILLAAAVGVHESFHLGLKIVVDSLPPKHRRKLTVVNNSLILIFGVTMAINGTRLAQFTIDHLIPSLNISRAFAFLPFVLAGIFISCFACEKALLAIVEKEE